MDTSYVVTKSNKLITSNYDLSLQEQKIILTLASMVQPQDMEFKEYKFKIKDFMQLLDVDTKTKYTDIPKITKELMKKVFEIKEGKRIIQIAWLSSAIYETGEGTVILKFDSNLKPYMLELKELYTSYKLENILSLKSKYSIRLYEILKSNLFKKQVVIELEELKKMLGATASYFKVYADFKIKALNKAQEELKEKTDIGFEFEEIKTGRKVTALKFCIKQNKPVFKAVEEISVTKDLDYSQEKNEVSMGHINEIKAMFKEDITDLDVKKVLDAAKGDINLVSEKYRLAADTPTIKNIVGWVIEAIKKDYKSTKGKANSTGNFNNFDQRTYDFDKLERELLGWDKETSEPTGAYQQLIIKGEKD